MKTRVAVAMSGGVDSSVAAALLAERGHEVFGLMLQIGSATPELANRCCSPRDIAMARRVAAAIGIPFYVLDAQEAFRLEVISLFLEGYARGVTPNPCLSCNREIRWGFLLGHAQAMGATHLATGHYARVSLEGPNPLLLRGIDNRKDQSYVLSVLNAAQLSHTLFPLGELTKEEVREHARRLHLPVADRTESQDLCFLGGQDYRQLLASEGILSGEGGPIVDPDGRPVGRHHGLANFTIGQRKGLGIASPHPLYVLHKDPQSDTLVVGPREYLGRTAFSVAPISWISGEPPHPSTPLNVAVRYRSREVSCTIHMTRGATEVRLAEALAEVAPGQAAVFYSGDVCLGGGTILP
jgi:tRNA-specific 2-thiouridylase